jgi:hypothetical protein
VRPARSNLQIGRLCLHSFRPWVSKGSTYLFTIASIEEFIELIVYIVHGSEYCFKLYPYYAAGASTGLIELKSRFNIATDDEAEVKFYKLN